MKSSFFVDDDDGSEMEKKSLLTELTRSTSMVEILILSLTENVKQQSSVICSYMVTTVSRHFQNVRYRETWSS